jgi:hypothetical protein
MIEQQNIGSLAALEILRNEQKLSLTATLEEIPTHEQQEAQHPDIEKCPDKASVLENVLRAQNTLPVYDGIVNELYRKSNTVHNPGAAYEKNSHPLQLNEVTYLMRHPLATEAVSRELSQRIIGPLNENDLHKVL